jgi:hypothetical protein
MWRTLETLACIALVGVAIATKEAAKAHRDRRLCARRRCQCAAGHHGRRQHEYPLHQGDDLQRSPWPPSSGRPRAWPVRHPEQSRCVHSMRPIAETPQKRSSSVPGHAVCAFRNHIVDQRQRAGASREIRERLVLLNSVLSVVLGCHFPLGDVARAGAGALAASRSGRGGPIRCSAAPRGPLCRSAQRFNEAPISGQNADRRRSIGHASR